MKTLNIAELANALESLARRGHRFVTFSLETTPELTKKHRDTKETFEACFPGVTQVVKITDGRYHFNMDYQNSTNRELERRGVEGDFEAQSLPWGQWVEGSKVLITHKGELYARMYQIRNQPVHTRILLVRNGEQSAATSVELEMLKGFLPKPKVAEGIVDEAKPITTTPKLSSVKMVDIDGDKYLVV